jgi:uncharacterized membrane protein HdeD (DUF308 family)
MLYDCMSSSSTERYIGAATPMWSRILRIVAGAVGIGLSFVVIAYPGLALEAAVVLLSVVLLISGMEMMAGGIFRYRSQRAAHIGIGALLVILAGLAIAFPIFSAFVVIALVAFGLMLSGVSSIIDGVGNKRMPGWARAFSIGVGALSIFVSGLAILSPLFGTIVVAFTLALGLIVYGTRLIASGVAGQRLATMTAAAAGSHTDTGATA